MFSLIIAIVSIALLVALVALGGYFGGDAVSDAQAATQAARLISEERQILASMDMFQADLKRWPVNLEELVSTGYLRSLPQGAKMATPVADSRFGLELVSSAHAADPVLALGWSMPAASLPIIYTVQVPKATCRAYNQAERGDNGILRQAFEVLPAQCYGVDGDYRVVVRKTGTNINLGGNLDSSVEPGNLPSKENEDWWDTAPDEQVKVPVDPVKTPKAELALAGSASLTFGQVQIGRDAISSPLTVTNRGKVAAESISVTAPAGFDLVDNTCGDQLAAGAGCSFAVSFAPTESHNYGGQVKVSTSNGTSVQASVSGEGVAGSATLSGINFGDLPAGNQVTQDAVLRNTGFGAIQLGGATITGAGFAVAPGGTCGSTLAAGQDCSIKVLLTAVGLTAHSGVLTVATAEVGSLTSALVGQSREARLAVSPSSENFGTVQINSQVLSSVVHTVSNVGNLPIASVVIPGTVGDFSVQQSTCTAGLAVGAACSFRVQFAPVAVADNSKSIDISGDGAAVAKVAVSGVGIAPAGTLSSLAFGDRVLNSQTDLVSVLKNTGVGPLAVTVPTAASVKNTTGTAFSFVSSTCSATLAPDATCNVTVRFTAPSSATTNVGTLSILAGGSTLVANLTGNSTAVTVTYSIGAMGTAGQPGLPGGVGGTTTLSVNGLSLTANGGNGGNGAGSCSLGTPGGTASGSAGALFATGGTGGGTSLGTGGGGGGGIGLGTGFASNGDSGGSGGAGKNLNGLQLAVTSAGLTFGTPGAAGTSSSGGKAATGFGGGGGGASGVNGGGPGGAGSYGGGGGGASSEFANSGGAGGRGSVVLWFADNPAATVFSSVILTTGTSYTTPAGKTLKAVWAIGAGGGGGGANSGNKSGCGGGAGAIANLTIN